MLTVGMGGVNLPVVFLCGKQQRAARAEPLARVALTCCVCGAVYQGPNGENTATVTRNVP